jgi:hypothetical protein
MVYLSGMCAAVLYNDQRDQDAINAFFGVSGGGARCNRGTGEVGGAKKAAEEEAREKQGGDLNLEQGQLDSCDLGDGAICAIPVCGRITKGRLAKWSCHFFFGLVLFFYLYHGPGWGATESYEGMNGQMRKGLVWSWWPLTVQTGSQDHYRFCTFLLLSTRTMVGIALSYFIFMMLAGHAAWLEWPLSLTVWVPVARLSYVAYLVQFIVLVPTLKFDIAKIKQEDSEWHCLAKLLQSTAVFVFVTNAIAYFVHIAVEAPALKLRHLFTPKVKPAPGTSSRSCCCC